MARSTQDLKLMVPIWGMRHEVWFPHHNGRQSTTCLYPHLRFPTTMDGKSTMRLYPHLCFPTTTDSKAQCLSMLIAALCCDCSLWTRSSRRWGKAANHPPSPNPLLLSEHLSGLSVLVWHWPLHVVSEPGHWRPAKFSVPCVFIHSKSPWRLQLL